MPIESFELDLGKVSIAFSDKNLTVGVFEVKAGHGLPHKCDQARQSLLQLKGKCLLKFYEKEGGQPKEVVLKAGDSFEIPAGAFHEFQAAFKEDSFTLWKAEGDVTDMVDRLRGNNP